MNSSFKNKIILILVFLISTANIAAPSLPDKWTFHDYQPYNFKLLDIEHNEHHVVEVSNTSKAVDETQDHSDTNNEFNLEDLIAHVEASIKSKEEILRVHGALGIAKEVAAKIFEAEAAPVVGEIILAAEAAHLGSLIKEYVNLKEIKQALEMVKSQIDFDNQIVIPISKAAYSQVREYAEALPLT